MPFDPNIGVATRWKKGQPSPNPGGRPKARLLSEALRARLAEVKPDDPLGRTFAEIVAENLVEIACSEGPGAVHAASEIADRIEGRSRQQIEVADFTADLRSRSDAELPENCRFWMEGSKHLMARVIEFYIPNRFQKKVAWVPPQRRGQVIEFCPLVKKSA